MPLEAGFGSGAVLTSCIHTHAGPSTIANVSIHPVALGPECLAVSSDWVGPFRAELERRVVPIELVEWQLGPVRLVSVPGEAFHALGRAIEARAGRHVLVAGLAPEWHGYLPVPFRDGYEESTSYGRDAVASIAAALTGGATGDNPA
jgi:hypothetical protein